MMTRVSVEEDCSLYVWCTVKAALPHGLPWGVTEPVVDRALSHFQHSSAFQCRDQCISLHRPIHFNADYCISLRRPMHCSEMEWMALLAKQAFGQYNFPPYSRPGPYFCPLTDLCLCLCLCLNLYLYLCILNCAEKAQLSSIQPTQAIHPLWCGTQPGSCDRYRQLRWNGQGPPYPHLPWWTASLSS